ncbi:MAG: hypothetical protein AAF985_20200, partial [Bacteroidota bacterium]
QADSVYTFSTSLMNKGIGPAIIKSAKIIAKDKIYPLDMDEFFKAAFPKLEAFGEFRKLYSIQEGNSLSANETRILFAYEFNENQMRNISHYLGVSEDFNLPFNIIIEYGSMYEENWRIDSKSNGHPLQLDH